MKASPVTTLKPGLQPIIIFGTNFENILKTIGNLFKSHYKLPGLHQFIQLKGDPGPPLIFSV